MQVNKVNSFRFLAGMLAVGLLPLLMAPAQAPAPEEETGPFVVVIRLSGMIDDGLDVVVKRAAAEAESAEALILVIDTPGGRVDSAIEITNTLLAMDVPTVAYIEGMGAISAGALISYACDTIFMRPATNIGASTPVMMGAEAADAVNEKSMSFIRAKYRALGEAKGHNPLLGEAMVDSDIELRAYPQADGAWRIVRLDGGEPAETRTTEKEAGTVDSIFDAVFGDLEQDLPEGLDELRSRLRRAAEEATREGATREEGEIVPASEDARWEMAADGGYLLSQPGKLLTLTSAEAELLRLSEATLPNLDAVLAHLELPDVRQVEIIPTWSEELFRWLTSPLVASLLLMLGFGGLYMEVRTPGFGIFGIVGLLCLALFFGAHVVIGLAGWMDLLLVVVGITLILVEIFVLPSFGLVGVAGIICAAAGLYMSMVRVPIPQFTWEFQRFTDAGITITLASAMLTAFAVLSWRLFPKSPMYSWLVLSEAQQTGQGYIVQTDEEEVSAVGLVGNSVSMLRPAGRGRFNGKTYDVVTRGEFLAPNVPIRIIQVEGNRYVVAEVKEEAI